jgi:hypothetical protein
MEARATRDRVLAALVDADFPAIKDDLLATAQRNGADEQSLHGLHSIPPVDYRNREEALRSVPLQDEAPEVTRSPRR